MHRIRSRRSLRTIIDQCAASDTGDVAVRAHRAGGCSFLDECHELPDDNGFEPGHLTDQAHRGVLRRFRWVTGIARQRRRGLGGTSGRMNEDDLAIADFNDHERSVVIERCSFGCHDPILGSGSLAARLPGLACLVRAAGLRWPVEEDFQLGKNCFGGPPVLGAAAAAADTDPAYPVITG
jgi:hypothetical protein